MPATIDTVADLIAALGKFPGAMKVRGEYDGFTSSISLSEGRVVTESISTILGPVDSEYFTDDGTGAPCVII